MKKLVWIHRMTTKKGTNIKHWNKPVCLSQGRKVLLVSTATLVHVKTNRLSNLHLQ